MRAWWVAKVEPVAAIRSCPLWRRSLGLEPYPQPSVDLPGATVTVRIYDRTTVPASEVTTSALSGAELSGPATVPPTVLAQSWELDMGHANVTALVDVETTEGADLLVVFTDNLGNSKAVQVVCNDAVHVDTILYPDRAIYCDDASGNTGTAFPNGSILQPSSLVASACSLLTNRGYGVLDISGATFDGGSDVPTAAKVGTALSGKTVRVRSGYSGVWFPNVDAIQVVDATFLGEGTLDIATYGNAWHAGPHTLIGCGVRTYNVTGTGSGGRWGELLSVGCSHQGDVLLGNQSGGGGASGTWSATFEKSTFDGSPVISCTGVGGSQVAVIEPTGGFEVDNASSKAIDIVGAIGSGDIVLRSGVVNSAVGCSGAYNNLADNGSGNTLTERQTAHTSGLTGNLITLAPNAVNATSVDPAGIQAALTAQGYTTARAPNLDRLDVTVGSVITQGDAAWTTADLAGLNDLDAIEVATAAQGALTAQGYTSARAGYLDRLDAAVSGVLDRVIGGVSLPQDSAAKWIRAIATALNVQTVWDASSGDADGVGYDATTGAPDTTSTRKRGYSMATDLTAAATTGGADDADTPDLVLVESATLSADRPELPTAMRGRIL